MRDGRVGEAMDVIALAGGFGTRLRPWTLHAPKPLLPILDRSMIEHVVSILPEAMVDRVLIAAGYGIDQMREYFAQLELPYEVVIVEETEPLGTGGAIANCRPHLSGEGTVCVINGDLLTSVRVDEMLANHQARGHEASITLWEVEDPSRFGVADFQSASGLIARFQEKPPREEAFSNLINAGTYLLEPSVFERMPEGAFSMERVVFPEMAAEGALGGFPFEGHFVDAGTPASYIEAMHCVIDNAGWRRGHSATAENVASSWFGGACEVAPSALVTKSAIDSGATVGAKSTVASSALLANVFVDADAEVTGCMVGEGACIQTGARLQDVVVDYGAVVPAGHVQNGGTWPIATPSD